MKEGMRVGSWELGNVLMVCEGMLTRFMLQVEGASVRKGVGCPGESVAWSLLPLRSGEGGIWKEYTKVCLFSKCTAKYTVLGLERHTHRE